jgi:outer membrane protein OmpA-like peptidoglycan-associated protein
MTQIADAFLRYPDIRLVEIQGHTDNRGNDAYNLDLSQRRADSVRAWLISAGVSADRTVAKGYGETQPLTSNKSRNGRARNRRVQFIIKERVEEPK